MGCCLSEKIPDPEKARLTRAFEGACDEATLTGAAGRDVIRRLFLERYTHDTSEEDLKSLVRTIIAQRRGLCACAKEKN